MKKTFYSNGKLLITGEYLVLDGSKSLALPTKYGQNLIVEKGTNQEIKWTSFDADVSVWFDETISFNAIKTKSVFENESVKNTLIAILHEAYLLNPKQIDLSEGFVVATRLTFPRKWGLGTSSTLINNIAQWFKINAFVLLKNSFGGSGYDIACAQNDCPIVYHLEKGKPKVEKVIFNPIFTSAIYFVYLNQKQSSKEAIASYNAKKSNLERYKKTITTITDKVLKSNDHNSFSQALNEHEKELSSILEIKTVKQTLFPDFIGTIKSLGAWGGDFVLAVSHEDPTSYFVSKGYETVIPYNKMIL
ncbi:ERG12 Mevalonate kinase [Flavobacteriaceae bacterium]